ncbi:gamma-glutamyltransferase 5a isoform 1-T2 [Pholidichthys leucotaenia]
MARTKACVRICFVLVLLIVIAIIVCIAVTVRKECPDGTFSKAAVAADSKQCSEIGRDILHKGGSAVDGAIASLICTSIIHPQSAGIGGGSVFTVMESSGKVKIFNSRETVPKAVNSSLLKFCPENIQMSGAKWIGVPGEIQAYQEAHMQYGKLPWAALFEPTIRLAREGFPVPPVLGRYISFTDTNQTWPIRKLFSDKNGNMLKTGDLVKFEKLADTLEVIAKEGPDAFYKGRIAEDLIRDIQEAGGTLTLQDLAEYEVTVTDAWAVPLGEFQMYIPPPPAGGVILSFLLNIMKEYMNSAPITDEQKILFYHRYAEALKFANGLKKQIRDPKFSSAKNVKKFIEKDFADHIRRKISNKKTHDSQYYNVSSDVESMGTSHVSVLAEDGSAVSATSSINGMFGSKVFSPSTGIILNNQLFDFCRKTNSISPGEKPPSSMAPVVLKSKSETLVIGGSGGGMITTGIASTIMNHLWFGKSLKEAIKTPVLYVDPQNALKFESSFDKDVIEALKALGHKREEAKVFYNVVNAVKKENGCVCAESDTRKLGEAAGY